MDFDLWNLLISLVIRFMYIEFRFFHMTGVVHKLING